MVQTLLEQGAARKFLLLYYFFYVIDAVFGPYSGVMVDIIDLFIFHRSSYHFSEVGALDKLFVKLIIAVRNL
jgi:hypothetical protein